MQSPRFVLTGETRRTRRGVVTTTTRGGRSQTTVRRLASLQRGAKHRAQGRKGERAQGLAGRQTTSVHRVVRLSARSPHPPFTPGTPVLCDATLCHSTGHSSPFPCPATLSRRRGCQDTVTTETLSVHQHAGAIAHAVPPTSPRSTATDEQSGSDTYTPRSAAKVARLAACSDPQHAPAA